MGHKTSKTVSTDDSISVSSWAEDCLAKVGIGKDRVSFTRLFDFYSGRIKSFFIQQGMDPTIAEELMQDVFVLIWRKASQFNPEKANASTWIYTIARNRRIDFIRKDIKRMEDSVEFLPDKEDEENLPEEKVIQHDVSKRITDILKNLPREQSIIIEQSYFKGLTHQEISDRNDIPLGTVKSRMRLAMERLKHAWDKQ